MILRRSLNAALLAITGACSDGASIPSDAPTPPIIAAPASIEMRVTVDAVTGEMCFEPVGGGPAAGVSAQIYGDQNVTIRLFNSIPTVTTTALLKTITANVAIQNLLPYPIGDEQGSSAPIDTIGIFIFFTQEPVVTATTSACAGGCFARVANYDGRGDFDQPLRKYFYFRDRIGAFAAPAGDTSRTRRPWIFEMSPEVTNFQFFVLVSAPWPAPYETRWAVRYRPDSLPAQSKPRWQSVVNGSGGSWSATNGQLSLSGNGNNKVRFVRRDSISSGGDAYIEAVAEVRTGNDNPKAVIGIADGSRLMALGFSRGRVGLLNAGNQYISETTMTLTAGPHRLQLRKYAADSVVYYIDGNRGGKALYSSLPATGGSTSFYFGTDVTTTGVQSTWTSVMYEIGVPHP